LCYYTEELFYYNFSLLFFTFMAFDPNQAFGAAPVPPAQKETPLTEQQIRTMRGDLGASPVQTIPTIPEKPLFDADEPAFSPNTSNQLGSVDALIAAEGGKRKTLWALGIAGGVIVLGLVGYFGVYPLLSGVNDQAENTEAAPIAPIEPVKPIAPIEPVAPAYTGPFINEPAARVTLTTTGPLSRGVITAALAAQAQIAKEGMTEILLRTESGAVSFSSLIAAILPALTEQKNTNTLFEEGMTAFIYKDSQGVWPGYVATLKPSFTAEGLRAWFTSLEKAPVTEFFLISPGTLNPFKEGMVSGKYPDRYAPGKTAGSSFSYLMLPAQNKVIISTSFEGLKEALRLMGL
jgi:hypothetical protein